MAKTPVSFEFDLDGSAQELAARMGTPNERRRLLLNLLASDGAEVLRRDVAGHVIGIVIPGENEVRDGNCYEVWSEVCESLRVALQQCERLRNAELAKGQA